MAGIAETNSSPALPFLGMDHGVTTVASAYLITFCCYGTRLPGQEAVVDCTCNTYGARFRDADLFTESRAKRRMQQRPYALDQLRRNLVLRTFQDVCRHRDWCLLAAHVRTNHVHSVVSADRHPEHVMNTLKSWASRNLTRAGLDSVRRQRWARHGSTRYLWTKTAIDRAIKYVVCDQGEQMAAYVIQDVPHRTATVRER